MTTLTPDPTVTTDLADRLFDSMLGTLDVLTIHVGDQLGLYDLLHRRGPLTAAEVAAGAGIDARYAREWLEQQTVAGLVSTEDASAAADVRRYHLTDEHASVLCNRDSLT